MWLIFIKEALLWQWLSSRNVAKILGVYETSISIMMEHLDFFFVNLVEIKRKKVNTLEKLFHMFDRNRQRHCQWNNQCSMLPSSKDIFWWDIKPTNVSFNNHYYSSLKTYRFKGCFSRTTYRSQIKGLWWSKVCFCANLHDYRKYKYMLYY